MRYVKYLLLLVIWIKSNSEGLCQTTENGQKLNPFSLLGSLPISVDSESTLYKGLNRIKLATAPLNFKNAGNDSILFIDKNGYIVKKPKYNYGDTICISIDKMKKIYSDALKYRYTDSLLKIAEAQLAEIKTNVSLLEEKDQETKNNYERQIKNLESQIAILNDQVKVFEKAVKRERRKRFWTSVGGTLTTAASLFLFFTK